MRKQGLYSLVMQLGLSRYDIDNILKSRTINTDADETRISVTTADTYKGGTHYGTISINDFL